MKINSFRLFAVGMAIALAAGACGGPAPAPSGGNEMTAVYVSTGPIGVNPFLQLIAQGLERGGQECNVRTKVVESTDATAMEDNFRAAIEDGTDLLVANSFNSVDAVTRLSAEFPEQKWAIVDTGIPDNPMVRGLVFREHEGMFLIGAIMGQMTESNVVGFVGAMDIPLIRRWWVGFEEGVRFVNPNATVLEAWGNSFNDPATSKELALAQFEQGADYIAAVSAAGNTGIFEAAAERGFFTSGVDTDQRVLDPEHIIESMVKRTDVGVYDAVCDTSKGQFSGGNRAYGLKENGVGPAFLILENLDPPSTLPAEVQDSVRALAEQIRSGELVVTDYLTEGS